MSKIMIIDHCDDCPHFDDEDSFFDGICTRLNKVNTRNDYHIPYTIPSDCPLKDYHETI